MSKLEKLIQELCPNGVEFKKTIDVANVSIGEFVHRNKQTPNGKYPVFNGGTSNTGYYDDYNRTANKIIVSARGNAGFVNRVFTKYWSGNSCYTIDIKDTNLDWNFAFYWFKNNESVLLGKQQKGGIPAVSKKQIESFVVPVPPLPVQEEIVRILDSFTALTAELQAELQARKKQYEFYRDKMLTFDNEHPLYKKIRVLCPDGINRYCIEEICDISRGRVMSKNYISENVGEYPVYSSQTENNGELGRISSYDFEGEYLTWTTDGANAGTVFYRTGKFSITNVCGLLKTKQKNILTKYLYYILNVETPSHVNKGMGNPKLMSNVMGKIKVFIPPLPVQEEIVRILDDFHSLCNDISEGLPAEIEARQKQYEYYRDKLLSFKEVEA